MILFFPAPLRLPCWISGNVMFFFHLSLSRWVTRWLPPPRRLGVWSSLLVCFSARLQREKKTSGAERGGRTFAKCDKCNTSHNLIDGRKAQLWRNISSCRNRCFKTCCWTQMICCCEEFTDPVLSLLKQKRSSPDETKHVWYLGFKIWRVTLVLSNPDYERGIMEQLMVHIRSLEANVS